MDVNRFDKLLNLLNVKLVMLVDDEFSLPRNPEKILSDMVYLNEHDYTLLKQESIFNDRQQYIKKLIEFINLFQNIDHNEHVIPLIRTGEILEYIETMSSDDQKIETLKILGKELISEIKDHSNNDEIAEIYLKYGITVNVPTNYVPCLNAIKRNFPSRSVRVYKEYKNIESIKHDTTQLFKNSSHEFCLSLVDRHLGKNIEEGEQFVTNVLIPLKNDINIASIIYTSNTQNNLLDKDKYYYFEISKTDPDAIEKIVRGLATCAYSKLFRTLGEITVESVTETFNLALNSKSNMLYLSKKASLEGITTYEAISQWTNLMQNNLVLNKILKKQNNISAYNLLVGLASMLNDDEVSSEEALDSTFEDAIRQLNTYEIFDYTVNKRHLPPQPGDIFYDSKQYYILIDQECDCTIRDEDSKRKSKYATLVSATFSVEILNEKIEKNNLGKGELKLNFFQNIKEQIGTLNISFGKYFTADYAVLDTCTFNDNGTCKFDNSKTLQFQLEKLLPLPWITYYEHLKNRIQDSQKIAKQLESINTSTETLNVTEFSLFNFKCDKDTITYPLTRICNVYGTFRTYVVKSFYDYRARIGLNTIAPSQAKKLLITDIEYGVQNNFVPIEVNIEAYLLQGSNINYSSWEKLPLSVNVGDLSKYLTNIELPRHILNTNIIVNSNTYVDNITGFKIIRENKKNNRIKLKLLFPNYKLPNNKPMQLEDLTLKEILSYDQQIDAETISVTAKYMDNNEPVAEIQRHGLLAKLSFINDIRRGIYIQENQICISISEKNQLCIKTSGQSQVAPSLDR